MITLFHCITICTTAAGLVAGGLIAGKNLGVLGGIAGACIGAYLGLIIGRMPGFIGKRMLIRKIKCRSTEELRLIIKGNEYYLVPFALAELASRKEDVQAEFKNVLMLMVSDDYSARVSGWYTLQNIFPETANYLEGYQACNIPEECQHKIQSLLK